MWKRRQPDGMDATHQPGGDALQSLVLQMLQSLAGSARGVVYGVPLDQRPRRQPGTSIFLDGSPSWSQFLAARRHIDDGELALILSLRWLDDDEARLVVDWGSTYANTFLLVGPRTPAHDLIDRRGAFVPALGRAAERAQSEGADEADEADEATDTVVGALIREAFGEWVWWPTPSLAEAPERTPFQLDGPTDTIAAKLFPELSRQFPQQAFDREVERLHFRERELFGGPVPRPRSVFRTRLGLPVLADPTCSDRALRSLVNRGRLSVFAPATPGRPWYGPGRPVPADLADDAFARFEMT